MFGIFGSVISSLLSQLEVLLTPRQRFAHSSHSWVSPGLKATSVPCMGGHGRALIHYVHYKTYTSTLTQRQLDRHVLAARVLAGPERRGAAGLSGVVLAAGVKLVVVEAALLGELGAAARAPIRLLTRVQTLVLATVVGALEAAPAVGASIRARVGQRLLVVVLLLRHGRRPDRQARPPCQPQMRRHLRRHPTQATTTTTTTSL